MIRNRTRRACLPHTRRSSNCGAVPQQKRAYQAMAAGLGLAPRSKSARINLGSVRAPVMVS